MGCPHEENEDSADTDQRMLEELARDAASALDDVVSLITRDPFIDLDGEYEL